MQRTFPVSILLAILSTMAASPRIGFSVGHAVSGTALLGVKSHPLSNPTQSIESKVECQLRRRLLGFSVYAGNHFYRNIHTHGPVRQAQAAMYIADEAARKGLCHLSLERFEADLAAQFGEEVANGTVGVYRERVKKTRSPFFVRVRARSKRAYYLSIAPVIDGYDADHPTSQLITYSDLGKKYYFGPSSVEGGEVELNISSHYWIWEKPQRFLLPIDFRHFKPGPYVFEIGKTRIEVDLGKDPL